MTLSVVIATRDRAAFLARALDSLAAQPGAPDFEVIVADNGSSDATAAVVAARTAAWAIPLQRVFVPEPNRAAARNAGIAVARGRIVASSTTTCSSPTDFSRRTRPRMATRAKWWCRVRSSTYRRTTSAAKPVAANYSSAFLCTCNVSVPRDALIAVGMFDEGFELYGWEDTDLGLRLRAFGAKRAFAWNAYLYHIKPPDVETLDTVVRKTVERAQMAVRLLAKDSGPRTRLATGAYALNLWRARVFAPAWSRGVARRLAENERLPQGLRGLARAQLLDVTYTSALRRALAEAKD